MCEHLERRPILGRKHRRADQLLLGAPETALRSFVHISNLGIISTGITTVYNERD